LDNKSLVEEFVKDIKLRGWSEWTVKSCSYTINLLEDSTNGIPFREIQKEHLRDFLVFLKARKGRKGSVSPETIRKHVNNLSSFFEFLEDEGHIDRSPVPQFRRKYVRNSFMGVKEGQQRQIIDPSQMRRLIGSILDPHDKAMFILLAKTGLRAQELMSIDVTDISLENLTINLKPTHKRKVQTVFFDYEAKGLLARWLSMRKELIATGEKALFITNDGHRMTHAILNKRLTRYAALVGLHDPDSSDLDKRFTTHCFRHYFTTQMINAGMPRDYVKELRGDTRNETIDIYRHLTMEELKREYLQRVPRLVL
jgi:integrase/recombinase XerD